MFPFLLIYERINVIYRTYYNEREVLYNFFPRGYSSIDLSLSTKVAHYVYSNLLHVAV